ncbi:DUF7000 family protein [Enterococcus sp. AZ196]|uniref:DUF7000 family protein n=1 Tax=Enterococcus sp. AZ196 TaxID=2774659 RepID=UPI003D2C5C0C
MESNLSEDIKIYQQAIYTDSPVCRAYAGLLKFIRSVRTDFFINSTDYKVGNLSDGYLDYTYFPFFDQQLRNDGLRFGIVLNHQDMRFELWLMAQNADLQIDYWNKLKHLKWNVDKAAMPKYTVLDTVIVEQPDFSDLEKLKKHIIEGSLKEAAEIRHYL